MQPVKNPIDDNAFNLEIIILSPSETVGDWDINWSSNPKLCKRRYLLMFPTKFMSKRAGLPYKELLDIYYDCYFVNYEEQNKLCNKVYDKLLNSSEVHIKSNDTDLTFTINKNEPVIFNGQRGIPDGEVFILPDKYSANGKIKFENQYLSFSSCEKVKYIELYFKDGKIINFKSDKYDLIKNVIETDEGSKYLGELGIGLNKGSKK